MSDSEEPEFPASPLVPATCSETSRVAADPMPALRWRSKRRRDTDKETDLTAETKFGVFGNGADARAALAQRRGDAVAIVAEAGDQTETGDDDAFHGAALLQ